MQPTNNAGQPYAPIAQQPGYMPNTPAPQTVNTNDFMSLLGNVAGGIGGMFGQGFSDLGSLAQSHVPTSNYSFNYRPTTQQVQGAAVSPLPTMAPQMTQTMRPLPTTTPLPTMAPTTTPTAMPAGSQLNAPSIAAMQQGLGRNPNIPQKPMSTQVMQSIQNAAKEFGIPSNLLFDIGYGEGGYRPDAANATPEGQAVGIPRGLFQFTPGTWNGDLVNYAKAPGSSLSNWLVNGQAPDRNDPVANARAAAYLISHGQLSRWDASKQDPKMGPHWGWGQYYSPQELASYYTQSPGYINP